MQINTKIITIQYYYYILSFKNPNSIQFNTEFIIMNTIYAGCNTIVYWNYHDFIANCA